MAATLKVIDIIRKAETILNDLAIRWPRIELQDWLNDAYRQIVLLKPEANSITSTVSCAAGYKQDLNDTGSINLTTAVYLLDVVQNKATSSTKKAVKLIDRKILADLVPDWATATASVNTKYWMFNPATPTEFMIYPQATAITPTPTQLEITYAAIPTAHALSESDLNPAAGIPNTTAINLDDMYGPAIVEFVLYNAFLKDSAGQNTTRVQIHLGAFKDALGAKQ